jgi:hypothetical protein
MKSFATRAIAIFAVGAALAVGAGPATAQRQQVGLLSCDISAGIGLIIGSQRQVSCIFAPTDGTPREIYVGTITKFGLDLGATAGGHMTWGVHSETTRRTGVLEGIYAGASAEATLGVGLGANVLVGGSNRTVALQPLSIQGQAGVNVAAGVAELRLQLAR